MKITELKSGELKLTIKRKWLEMLISGKKKEEYRDITPYYKSRIEQSTDTVEFTVGRYFSPDAPRATFEFLGCTQGLGKAEWGAPDYDVYKIRVGKLIEKFNI